MVFIFNLCVDAVTVLPLTPQLYTRKNNEKYIFSLEKL